MAVVKKKNKLGTFIKNFFSYLFLCIIGLFMIIPFVWMLSTSLKEPGNIFVFPPQWIPNPIVFQNYVNAWNAAPFGRFFINSIFISGSLTIGSLLTGTMAGYAFARLEFPGRDKVFMIFLGTMMIPGQVTMIPVFIILKYIGWIDSYKALIVPGIFGAGGAFFFRQFFMAIPKELEEAAIIDGCSNFKVYWRIILPLSKPALATLGTFTFLGAWNDFMWPLIVLNSPEKMTLPVGLAYFTGQYTTDWPLLMAGSMIILLPVIIVYVFNQRFFVKGIVMSGMKG
ncbi:MAG: sugar ABC transporter permease [Elusimicrobia bacterium RIFOXYA2_FULL_40_6]|nr:MAG: sugar ABC transporter permease [Elusimicrobia bacterium RIFOXYA2_FULL_40_6]